MPKTKGEWLVFSLLVAGTGYGLLLLILSWLHVDPCSLHLPHRHREDSSGE